MPIYEYVCTACDHRTDILLGLNDPGPKFCPSCGAEDTMRKQFAPPTIHYKGSGWAKKDRGSASAGSRAKSTDGAKDASPASSSADGAKDPSSSSAPSDGSSSSSSTSDGPKPSSTD
jgi:putative FmdB family regulatory protein